MSRTIKAIKLLHLLKETTSNNDDYIKVAKLMKELETDDRNIRRIVKLLNESLDISIVSKTGREGGYRLNTDIYEYFLGVSSKELVALGLIKDHVIESNISATTDQEDFFEDKDAFDENEFIIL